MCLLGLYDIFYILFLLFSLAFHIIRFTILLVVFFQDVLGMFFSAVCNMVLTRQLCASSIVFWSCPFVVILFSFWKKFTLPMFHLECFLVETFLSSSILRFTSVRSIFNLQSLYALFYLRTRGCIWVGFSPTFFFLCSFFHFPTLGCVRWSFLAVS